MWKGNIITAICDDIFSWEINFLRFYCFIRSLVNNQWIFSFALKKQIYELYLWCIYLPRFCDAFVSYLYTVLQEMWPMIVFSAGHVSHVPKNRRNDARAERFSTNSWRYNKCIILCERRKYMFYIMFWILVRDNIIMSTLAPFFLESLRLLFSSPSHRNLYSFGIPFSGPYRNL